MLTPEEFMKADPPTGLSEYRKELWKCVSPRMRTVFAIALDWGDDNQFWDNLDKLQENGFKDIYMTSAHMLESARVCVLLQSAGGEARLRCTTN